MNKSLKGKSCIVLMATYNDWLSIAHVVPVLNEHFSNIGMKAKIVVVDDSSDDLSGKELVAGMTLNAIESIDEIQLGSNQGNQRAMAIGVAYIANNYQSDYLIVMDSDNEDRPDDVPALLQECLNHEDRKIVFAERTKRSEGLAFRFLYFMYKKAYRILTGSSISVGNFCAIPGHMIRRLAHIAELWNHFPISIIRAGLPFTKIPSERGKRLFGQGNMNIVKLIVHAFSGFVIHADTMAVRIILLAGWLGGAFLLFVTAAIVIWYNTNIFMPGWTSLMLMMVFLLFMLILSTAATVLFFVLSLRMQPPMIPFHDHHRFIYKINHFWAPKID